jgi:two-component system phosphate regulon sensor histidine kinase PhoR
MAGPLDRMWVMLRGGERLAAGQDSETGPIPPRGAASDEDAALVDLLADAVTDGILQVDAVGRVQGMNRAAWDLFGTAPYPPPRGEMIGLTLLEATHLPTLADLCAEAYRTDSPREAEVRQIGRAERLLWARAVPQPESVGTGTLLLLTDLTEVSRLRTVRTEFVANVSHELRTPLASIRATAETLLDGAITDPEYSGRFLETIIREADRLVQLSEDLLDLSRAESNRRVRTRFDLRGLVMDVVARLMGQAERRSITLELPPLVAPPVWIDADRSEMDQVFFNLVDNAVKYTPSDGRVGISVEVRPAEKRVAVCVADTGIGILSQDLPRIFERFWRADRARRFQSSAEREGPAGGTGLGLSIVKHIVEAHGGVVTAESELGQGSRFTVLLPLALLDDAPGKAAPNEEDKD